MDSEKINVLVVEPEKKPYMKISSAFSAARGRWIFKPFILR